MQTLALQVGHHKEPLAAGFLESVDGADVGMIELGRRLRFAQKAFIRLVHLERFIGEKLESDGAAEFGVLGFVHHTHSSFADLLEDAVV